MKKLFLIALLCSYSTIFAQDKFNESIVQLEHDFEYFSKSKVGNKNYMNTSSVVESFKISKKYCEENYPNFKAINFDEFISVKSANVKSKKPLKGKTYLRVTIEEWSFGDEESAKMFENRFEQIDIQCLNKGGIKFWRIKEN